MTFSFFHTNAKRRRATLFRSFSSLWIPSQKRRYEQQKKITTQQLEKIVICETLSHWWSGKMLHVTASNYLGQRT